MKKVIQKIIIAIGCIFVIIAGIEGIIESRQYQYTNTELIISFIICMFVFIGIPVYDDWYNNYLDKLREKIREQEAFEKSEESKEKE